MCDDRMRKTELQELTMPARRAKVAKDQATHLAALQKAEVCAAAAALVNISTG